MSVASDLAAMLTGWDRKAVVVGSFAGYGLVDEMDMLDTDRGGDPVLVRRTVVRLRKQDHLDAAGLVNVARGDTITIDTVAYSVADVRVGGADGRGGGEELDGRELHLTIRKV